MRGVGGVGGVGCVGGVGVWGRGGVWGGGGGGGVVGGGVVVVVVVVMVVVVVVGGDGEPRRVAMQMHDPSVCLCMCPWGAQGYRSAWEWSNGTPARIHQQPCQPQVSALGARIRRDSYVWFRNIRSKVVRVRAVVVVEGGGRWLLPLL